LILQPAPPGSDGVRTTRIFAIESVGGVVVERPHVSLVSDASAALVVNDILNRFEKRFRSDT
jgi:hypothetical protein